MAEQSDAPQSALFLLAIGSFVLFPLADVAGLARVAGAIALIAALQRLASVRVGRQPNLA